MSFLINIAYLEKGELCCLEFPFLPDIDKLHIFALFKNIYGLDI